MRDPITGRNMPAGFSVVGRRVVVRDSRGHYLRKDISERVVLGWRVSTKSTGAAYAGLARQPSTSRDFLTNVYQAWRHARERRAIETRARDLGRAVTGPPGVSADAMDRAVMSADDPESAGYGMISVVAA